MAVNYNGHILLKGTLGARFKTPSRNYVLAWMFDEWWYYARGLRNNRLGDDFDSSRIEDPHRRKRVIYTDSNPKPRLPSNVKEMPLPQGVFDSRLNVEIYTEGKRTAIVQQCNCVDLSLIHI